jgi:hypothetical protein
VRAPSLVFTTAQGKPQSRRNALRALHNAGDAADLNGDDVERSGFTISDIRSSRSRSTRA